LPALGMKPYKLGCKSNARCHCQCALAGYVSSRQTSSGGGGWLRCVVAWVGKLLQPPSCNILLNKVANPPNGSLSHACAASAVLFVVVRLQKVLFGNAWAEG
jgi:heme A synthase